MSSTLTTTKYFLAFKKFVSRSSERINLILGSIQTFILYRNLLQEDGN